MSLSKPSLALALFLAENETSGVLSNRDARWPYDPMLRAWKSGTAGCVLGYNARELTYAALGQ